MEKASRATEELKVPNPMRRVELMNTYKAQVEEIIFEDLEPIPKLEEVRYTEPG